MLDARRAKRRGSRLAAPDCTTLLVIELETFEVIARQPSDEAWFLASLYGVP